MSKKHQPKSKPSPAELTHDKENELGIDAGQLLKKILTKIIPSGFSKPQSKKPSPQSRGTSRRNSEYQYQLPARRSIVLVEDFQPKKGQEQLIKHCKAADLKLKQKIEQSLKVLYEQKCQQKGKNKKSLITSIQPIKLNATKSKHESRVPTKSGQNTQCSNRGSRQASRQASRQMSKLVSKESSRQPSVDNSKYNSKNNSCLNSRQNSPIRNSLEPTYAQEELKKPSTRQSQDQSLCRSLFNLKNVIGRGGFGRVWRVQSKQSHKEYALKIMSKALLLSKKSVSSALNERTLLSELSSPFIVNMAAAFQDRETLYLLLELMPGGDFRTFLARRGRIGEQSAKFYISCVIAGLQYLQGLNVIHRDIKPQNLVFDEKGYLRITDFGIARHFRENNSEDTSGTPGYMAPQVLCRQNHSFSVDYFALGVLLFEMMQGFRPYQGASRKEIKDQILAKQVQLRVADLPEGWTLQSGDFVNKLLQRKPANRIGHLGGISELKKHSWLRSYNWSALYDKKLFAPQLGTQRRQEEWRDWCAEEDNLASQNQLLLRRDSIQGLFKGYQCIRE